MLRWKRLGAMLVGAAMLNATLAPTVATAMSAYATRDLAGAKMDLLNRDGTVALRRDGANWVRGIVSSVREFRGMDRAMLDSARAALMTASRSPLGATVVPRMLQILDVVSAPTADEFIARAAMLPVVLHRSTAADNAGREGTMVEFEVNGKVRARTFLPHTQVAGGERLELESGEQASQAPPASDCYYADEEGSWTGTCATETEILSATAVYVALEAEVEVVEADVASHKLDFCGNPMNYSDPYCTNDQDAGSSLASTSFGEGSAELAMVASVAMSATGGASETLDTPSSTAMELGAIGLTTSPDSMIGTDSPCWGNAIVYTATLANWGIKLMRFGAALAIATGGTGAPASAIIEVMGGAVTATALVVGAGAALYYCQA